jgi:chemotaxis protein MotB
MLFAVGCGQGPKDQQIEAQQIEIARLQGEKQDLMNRLARALSERDEARGRALDLQQQLADMEAQIARGEGARQREGWTELPGLAYLDIADNILFDSGKADLKSAGKQTLQQIIADIRAHYADRQIWIVGHTDSDPIKHSKWKDNLELSVQRACTVFRELRGSGLDPSRMVAAGQGEYNPKAANTAQTKHLNRRVRIMAVELREDSTPPGDRG